MKDLNKIKEEADQLYLRAEYEKAKRLYVYILSKLKRRRTLKYIDIKKCIVNCQMHLDLDSSIDELNLKDKLNKYQNKHH